MKEKKKKISSLSFTRFLELVFQSAVTRDECGREVGLAFWVAVFLTA
jgi:hypothetical protein